MAGQRLTDKSVYNTNLAADDILMVVDTSDTTGSPQGTSKSIQIPYITHTQNMQINDSIMNNLDGNPVPLLTPAPAGYFYNVMNVSIRFANTTTQNTVVVDWFLMWSLTPPLSVPPPTMFANLRRPYRNVTNPEFIQTNSFYPLTGQPQSGDPEGLGFWLMSVGNMNLAGTTANIYTSYTLQKV
tara:strand:- start:291 stop:842 length:552 start_codon:yes stop_codon:yes gene_type:complete